MSAGAELLYDTRDDLISPTSGGRFRADYLYGKKRNDTLSAGIQRAGADLQFYYLLFPRQVLAFGIHGRSVEGALVDESDLIRLGGFRTLRGYRENQVMGSVVGWANLEYRFLAGRRTYLFGFADAGYYRRPADEMQGVVFAEAFKLGFGVGARLDTALGNIGVSVAIGQGDSIGMAKIHVGLINDF
jgi:outer membrane protein assembly factor BamA